MSGSRVPAIAPAIHWERNWAPATWDAEIARLKGHPLQTALWGNARSQADGIPSECYAAVLDGNVIWAARVEPRRIPFVGSVAWVPRGPTAIPGTFVNECLRQCLLLLHRRKYVLCVVDPWERAQAEKEVDGSSREQHARTVWIDLGVGRDRLWANLDKKVRWGVGRAKRDGLVVEETRSLEDLEVFFRLCVSVSRMKGFRLPTSLKLMQALLEGEAEGVTGAHLFVARIGPAIGAGAFILRCGESIHYMWGATDRGVSKLALGEATQWAILEWAAARGLKRFDLEGIDRRNNPGVYAFKKKLGGEEIMLSGKQALPLRLRGTLVRQIYGMLPGRQF